MSGCEDIRHELGAYVLGALPEDEEIRVREHLARCAACRDEHARLAGMRPMLDLAAPGLEGRAMEPPSPLLEEAVLAGFAAERKPGRRRRSRPRWFKPNIMFPSAAVGAALAVLVLALTGALGGDDAATAETAVNLRGAEGSAHAVLATAEAGTVIELDAELPPSGRREHYEVWMTAGDYRITAGSFRVGSDGRVSVELACGGPLDAYDGIEVTRGEGGPVLSASL